MAANKYDVFISYRRPDGASMARQIDAALAKHGFNPFLNLSDISRGHFEFALLKRVAETPNLLLVLTPGALERCRENGDGLGQEIAQAIASSRNIIPVVLPGFEFPNDLPRPLHDLLERQGVECSETLSAPAVATILQRVCFGIRRKRWLARRRAIVAGLIAAVVLVGGLIGTTRLPDGASTTWRLFDRAGGAAAIVGPARSNRLEATLAGVRGTADLSLPPVQRITYNYRRDSDGVRVAYQLPYLDLVREGQTVEGLNFGQNPFCGEVPELVVRVYNGTERAIGLETINLRIDSSKIVADCVPVFEDQSPGSLRVANQGWARIELPKLLFSIASNNSQNGLAASEMHTHVLATIADEKAIPLASFTPTELSKEMVLKVSGTMQYGEPGDRRTVAFSTRVRNDNLVSARAEKLDVYNADFRAGEIETVTVALQPGPKLEPGDTATFPIRVKTDRTSRTRLSVDFKTSEGTVIRGEPFLLELFVPRRQSISWNREDVKREVVRPASGP